MALGRAITRVLAITKRSYASGSGYQAAVLKEFKKPLEIETVKAKPAIKSDQVLKTQFPLILISNPYNIDN